MRFRNFHLNCVMLTCTFTSFLLVQAALSNAQAQSSVSFTQSVNVAPPRFTTLPDGRVVYTIAGKMPEYPEDLTAFLLKNLRYPASSKGQNSAGKVVARFIVNSDGNVSDIEIQRSSGDPEWDAEVVRVIGLMKSWRPGIEKGNPVAVMFYLPVEVKQD